MTDEQKQSGLASIITKISENDVYKDTSLLDSHMKTVKEVFSDGALSAYDFLRPQVIALMKKGAEYVEPLVQNLKTLQNEAMKSCNDDPANKMLLNVKEGITSLYYSLNSLVGAYTDQKKESIEDKLNRLESEFNVVRTTATDMIKTKDEIESRLENNKVSAITSLTIFSAVVLAFSGGITFEAGMFKGIASTTPFRLVFMITLSGLLLFNTIFMLLYISAKMTGKHIGMRCNYMRSDESVPEGCRMCGQGVCVRKEYRFTALCKLAHRFFYVGFVNLLFLMVLYYDFIFWLFAGWGYNIFSQEIKIAMAFAPLLLLLLRVLEGCIGNHILKKQGIMELLEVLGPYEENEKKGWDALCNLDKKHKELVNTARKSIREINGRSSIKTLEKHLIDYYFQVLYDPLEPAPLIKYHMHKHNTSRWRKLLESISSIKKEDIENSERNMQTKGQGQSADTPTS